VKPKFETKPHVNIGTSVTWIMEDDVDLGDHGVGDEVGLVHGV
jgi:hypothetical protein